MSSISIAFVVWSKMLSAALTLVAGGVAGSNITLPRVEAAAPEIIDDAAAQSTDRRPRALPHGTPYRTRAPSSSAEAYWARCRLHEQPLQVSFETAGRQWLVPSSARILSRGLTSDAI